MSVPRSLTLLLVLSTTGGCKSQSHLSGKVSFQGKPVVVGTVQLLCADGVPRSCVLQDGTYSFRNLPTGAVELSVNSPDPVKIYRPDKRKFSPASKLPPPKLANRDKWFAIPEKYASFSTAELNYLLQPGNNQFDIDLK